METQLCWGLDKSAFNPGLSTSSPRPPDVFRCLLLSESLTKSNPIRGSEVNVFPLQDHFLFRRKRRVMPY